MALVLALVSLFLLVSVCMLPQRAFAQSLSCSRVDIVAQAESNADLRVVEQRTFGFEGSYSQVRWVFADLSEDAVIEMHGVRFAQVNEQGDVVSEWIELPEASFSIAWRGGGGPAESAFAVDAQAGAAYVFSEWADETVVIELDYTIVGAIAAYEDMAELAWCFVPADGQLAAEDVTATIALPVPAGGAVAPDRNVFAWGHGPADGQVKIGLDGTVTYQVPSVPAGRYSEARVLFPVDWLTNASREVLAAHQGELILENVQSQEETWRDSSAAWWVNRLKLFSIESFLFGGLLLIGLLAYALCGRECKPDFTAKYLREVPADLASLQPAVLGRLWRWDRSSTDDFVATVLHLVRLGVVRVAEGEYEGPDGKPVRDLRLTVVEDAACACEDPIERATLNMLFLHWGKGRPALWTGSIRSFAQEDPREFAVLMKDWQCVLSLQSAKEELFDLRSFKLQKVFAVLALVSLAAGLCLAGLMGGYEPALMGLASAAGLGLIANYMPRRSEWGNNLVARCKALKNWMRDSGLVVGGPRAAGCAGGCAGESRCATGCDSNSNTGSNSNGNGNSACELQGEELSNQMLVLAYVFELAEDKTAAVLSAALKSAAKSADKELAKRGKAYNIEG